jgi:hypothetical protein
MRPAFASTWQAAAFALLLLVLLLLPVMMTKSWLPPREEIYSSIWWANGAFPYIDQQIFSEKGDIDIAFVGASHIWNAFNPAYVQQKLSEKLGRPATVRTIGWGGAGYDELYVIARDLLQHRKVHMLVFYDAFSEQDQPNLQAPHWFRFGDDADAIDGLPLRLQASYYFAAVLGMPRNLLELFRSNLPTDLHSPKTAYWENLDSAKAENISSNLGALAEHVGFSDKLTAQEPFEPFNPSAEKSSADVITYSPEMAGQWQFTGPALPSWQLHFARKFAALGAQYGCKFVLLHLPTKDEMTAPVIRERELWPEDLQADVTMMGIPPAKLFLDMTEQDVKKLYSDNFHFNKNGQDYFTATLTPALLEFYVAQVPH